MAGGIIPLKVLYTQQQKEQEGPGSFTWVLAHE